jgi:hypothetical protein
MRILILTAAICLACLAFTTQASAADASTPSAAPTPQATPVVPGVTGGTGTQVTPGNTHAGPGNAPVTTTDPGTHHHDHDQAQNVPAPSQSATPVGPTNDATHLWQNPESPSNPGQKPAWDHSPQPQGPQPMDHIQNP